jgi:hypothetical protein
MIYYRGKLVSVEAVVETYQYISNYYDSELRKGTRISQLKLCRFEMVHLIDALTKQLSDEEVDKLLFGL